MTRFQKKVLPPTDPLWKAVKQEAAARKRGVADVAAQETLCRLNDEVISLLDTGGEIKLKDQSGALVTVKIKGLHEF